MNGYTKGARNELFALRPAPIQVSVGKPALTSPNLLLSIPSINFLKFTNLLVMNFRIKEII